jgi:hypothetical protein
VLALLSAPATASNTSARISRAADEFTKPSSIPDDTWTFALFTPARRFGGAPFFDALRGCVGAGLFFAAARGFVSAALFFAALPFEALLF